MNRHDRQNVTECLGPKDIAARFEEAARTLRALPDTNRPKGYEMAWPEVVRDACESYGWDAARAPRIVPSPAAVSRMEECFTWLSWLEPREARIVWLRAEGVRWRPITWRVGCTRQHAARLRAAALERIARIVHRRDGLGKKARDKCDKSGD